MKPGKMIYRLLMVALFALVFIQNAESCSMFKITMQGKTMVGNNEDFWNPNTRIWFEKGKKNELGAAYVGYDNFMPQGGINQAGLVYDGFAMPFMAVRDTIGKIVPKENFINNLMKKCKTVDDVKNYLSHYNLSFMASGMFLFIDKCGKYLIAEGDSLITGENQY